MMFFCLIVTALFGTNADAEASSQGGASICGRKMTFLVWPHGHPAMKYADFPEIRNTHIDIYLGFADTYPDSRAGGYVLAGKPPAGIPNGAAIGPCLNYGTALANPGTIGNPKTISRPARVDCTLPSGAVIDIVDGPGRSETSSSTSAIGRSRADTSQSATSPSPSPAQTAKSRHPQRADHRFAPPPLHQEPLRQASPGGYVLGRGRVGAVRGTRRDS